MLLLFLCIEKQLCGDDNETSTEKIKIESFELMKDNETEKTFEEIKQSGQSEEEEDRVLHNAWYSFVDGNRWTERVRTSRYDTKLKWKYAIFLRVFFFFFIVCFWLCGIGISLQIVKQQWQKKKWKHNCLSCKTLFRCVFSLFSDVIFFFIDCNWMRVFDIKWESIKLKSQKTFLSPSNQLRRRHWFWLPNFRYVVGSISFSLFFLANAK